ncbi:MAG: transcription termination factor NusA [Patescibacteria group bacterium]
MSQSPIQAAIQQICQEKNLSEESVLRTIELALAAAYRKDFGNKLQNIVVKFDPKTGGLEVFDVKTVVEDLPEEELELLLEEEKKPEKKTVKKETPVVPAEGAAAFVAEGEEEEMRRFNPRTEIQLKDAKAISKKYKIGDEIVTDLPVPGEFGRMAAQTAKQVIIQKIREEERQNIFDEYKTYERQVVVGTIQRRDGRLVLVDIGRATAIMPPEEQVERERYNVGNRMKFYLKSVDQTSRGPQLVISRANPEIIRKIFETEIPEIANGAIEIKSIAREPGNRSKVAIFTSEENIDPIGSCVGQRGARIQTIIGELSGEKIDIILFDEDAAKFITNALSPAKVASVELKETGEEKVAFVKVKDDQLSLAIGRGGQNVRLASRLTGWKIDIVSDGGKKPEVAEEAKAADAEAMAAKEEKAAEVKTKAETAPEIKEEKEEKAEKKKRVKKTKEAEVQPAEEAPAEAEVKEEVEKKTEE